MTQLLKELWRADKNINADIFGGNRLEDMSGRMGRKLVEGDNGCCKIRMYFCKVLSWFDPRPGDHCINSVHEK